jgi:DNA polymerase-3 subunit epsilon
MSPVPTTAGLPVESSGNEPDRAGPWDLPIGEVPLAFIDLEMTGLDLEADRVIEIAIVRRRGECIEAKFESLLDPGPLAVFHTDVHGLTADALRGAPSFAELAPTIAELLQGAILVAHAAAWDVAFLEAEFARLGLTPRFAFLDTLTLARRALRAESHSLQALANQFEIVREKAHRAGDDVRVLALVFDQLLTRLAPRSARDLWHVRVAQRHARPEIVERCQGFSKSAECCVINYRPSHKAPRLFEAVLTQVRTDVDPPRVLGYSLPGRGRFDLRADRILSVIPCSSSSRTPKTEPRKP